MNLQQNHCPFMIIIIIKLTLITATATIATTIENETTSSTPISVSTYPSISLSPSSNHYQYFDQLISDGKFDLLPSWEVIKLLDQVTNGLITRLLNGARDLRGEKGPLSLVQLSNHDLVVAVDKQSNGLVRSTLDGLNVNDLKLRYNQLIDNYLDRWTGQSKRSGSDSMSSWTVGSSKRRVRSIRSSEPIDKRNFDEIDRQAFSGFTGKRNFDEIDRSAFSGFNGKRNFDEIDRSGLTGFRGRRNFDEIDRSSFSGFTGGKRDPHYYLRQIGSPMDPTYYYYYSMYPVSKDNQRPEKRNFDEIDRTSFSGLKGKRNFDEVDSSSFTDLYKRNFDEIDNSGFTGFYKRNFDEIDRSAFNRFIKSPRLMGNQMKTINNNAANNNNKEIIKA